MDYNYDGNELRTNVNTKRLVIILIVAGIIIIGFVFGLAYLIGYIVTKEIIPFMEIILYIGLTLLGLGSIGFCMQLVMHQNRINANIWRNYAQNRHLQGLQSKLQFPVVTVVLFVSGVIFSIIGMIPLWIA